jgi:ABC-type Fe3+ transport system substrate-binding protein
MGFGKESNVKVKVSKFLFVVLNIGLLACEAALAASAPAVQKAKQEAESKNYVFFSNHDEIVARAKKEGKLRILVNMEVATLKGASTAFNQRYPFINLQAQEITGVDQVQRNILEIKSGRAKEYDVVFPVTDFYSEYLPYLWKVDLLGMAEHGVLQIHTAMIDPKNRNIAAFYTRLQVTAYNKDLVKPVPKLWEDILKPEFKGKKFAADIRPTEIALLVPAWGLEKTLDFARKLAAQQPVWVRGGSRTFPAIIAGEVPMMVGPNFHTVKRAQTKDRTGLLQYVALEPVPMRMHSEQAILSSAENPHAALLWMEWMASAESQKLADEHEPLGSSHYFRGGAVEQEIRGKKLSWASWEHHHNIEAWQAKIFEVYGFPKAEK